MAKSVKRLDEDRSSLFSLGASLGNSACAAADGAGNSASSADASERKECKRCRRQLPLPSYSEKQWKKKAAPCCIDCAANADPRQQQSARTGRSDGASASPRSAGGAEALLDSSGRPLLGADGSVLSIPPCSIGPGGVLLDANGRPVLGADGQPIRPHGASAAGRGGGGGGGGGAAGAGALGYTARADGSLLDESGRPLLDANGPVDGVATERASTRSAYVQPPEPSTRCQRVELCHGYW